MMIYKQYSKIVKRGSSNNNYAFCGSTIYSNQDEWRYTQQLLDRFSVVYTDVFSMKDHSDTVGNTETMMI